MMSFLIIGATEHNRRPADDHLKRVQLAAVFDPLQLFGT
jgi:hypothetical protein